MKNEFKLIAANKTHTRYVLENASSGGTSSGSIASVSGSLGGVRKRDNILAQEAGKNKSVPASTPRNFVAKNAKTGGAGAHKDKKKAEKQGQVKHKQPFMEDHEIQMASSELMSIVKNSQNLLKLVQRYSEQQGLDAWQQSKITKAADYLNSVLQSVRGEQSAVEGYSVVPGIDQERYQQRPGLEGPFNTKSGKVVYYDPQEGKYYDPNSDFYISHDDWQAMNEDDSALNAYLSKGGKITQLPYKKPRKADKTNYGSKHIGGSGDKNKPSRTGLGARTQGNKLVGMPESPELNELDVTTMQDYREKRKQSPTATSLRQAATRFQGMRSAKEKIQAKKTDDELKAKGDPRVAEGRANQRNPYDEYTHGDDVGLRSGGSIVNKSTPPPAKLNSQPQSVINQYGEEIKVGDEVDFYDDRSRQHLTGIIEKMPFVTWCEIYSSDTGQVYQARPEYVKLSKQGAAEDKDGYMESLSRALNNKLLSK